MGMVSQTSEPTVASIVEAMALLAGLALAGNHRALGLAIGAVVDQFDVAGAPKNKGTAVGSLKGK